MAVYVYYYGAAASRGIGVQAESPELRSVPVYSDLKGLASLHALESSEHSGEMLSYLLGRDGFCVLGVSYTESPKSSGYNRSAPCGLQYVFPEDYLKKNQARLGRIVNFVNFQKPDSPAPQPLSSIPLSESGYSYHSSPAVLAPFVDALARTALSDGEVLLVGLPKGRNSDYGTARYAIAEALACLPAQARVNIRFFTGLPVDDGVTDPLAGFDNAVKYGANVIFCPNEYFKKLTSTRTCIGFDMSNPPRQYGSYAGYVTKAEDQGVALFKVSGYLGRPATYEGLNRAAEKAAEQGQVSVEELQAQLSAARKKYKSLEKDLAAEQKKAGEYKAKLDDLQSASEFRRPAKQVGYDDDDDYYGNDVVKKTDEPKKGKGAAIVLYALITIVLMALSALAAALIASRSSAAKDPTALTASVPEETPAASAAPETSAVPETPAVSEAETTLPAETLTEASTEDAYPVSPEIEEDAETESEEESSEEESESESESEIGSFSLTDGE